MQQTTTAAAAGHAADQAAQFSWLPAALLTRILKSLPQQERLTSCATVCKSWAEAAAAATVEVDVSNASHKRIAAFQAWLEQHAGQLVSFRVQGLYYNNTALHLPFFKQLQQLSRLDLQDLDVQLNPAEASSSSSSYTGAASMPAKLQELRLHSCKLSRSTLLQLAQLSGITKLELHLSGDFRGDPSPQPEAIQGLLQGLSNLESLDLAGPADAADIMPVLSAHSLTSLTLYRSKLPDSASWLVNLRELQLTAELSPVALAKMTMLTKLELSHCQPAAGADGSTSCFLAAVRGMCQLQHLEVLDSCKALLQAAEPRACAALTASGQLICLDICTVEGQPLPVTALQHMYPAGQQLLQVRWLAIRTYDNLQDAGHIMTAELSSLVDACPGLTCLHLTCVLAADADVSALLRLPQQCQHFGNWWAGVW